MNKYNDQYYIVMLTLNEDRIFVDPLQKTADRNYHFKKQPIGSEPFFFENSDREEDKKDGITHLLPDVLMEGANLLVNQTTRDYLKQYTIYGLQMNPSIYIDDNGNWHENYWFLTFFETVNCLDRVKSDVEEIPAIPDNDKPLVNKYSLDSKVLDKIPEENRLLFKMGNVTDQYVFVHQRIADYFAENNVTGIHLSKVSEFEEGDQY